MRKPLVPGFGYSVIASLPKYRNPAPDQTTDPIRSRRSLIVDVPSMEGLGCQVLIHDQGIDEPKALMAESARKCADDVEAELLPEADGPFIRGND